MALTPSAMLPLGTIAPDFTLIDTISQKPWRLKDAPLQTGTVIMFICNHCPFVKHILPKLLETIQHYQPLGIQFIAINANDVIDYPEDHPDKMRKLAHEQQFTFPYLFDETQTVAKDYKAQCTPDFFVFDQHLKCVYRGRFDETSPGKLNSLVTGNDLRQALDDLLNHQTIKQQQYPSMGCNIKWKT